MSEVDTEIAFKEDDSETEETTPPNPITTCDMDVIIRGWEEKFARISECLREVQTASERANSDMCLVSQEARAQGEEQERRLETMHEGLQDFIRKFEPARPPNTPHVDAPTASTPYGVPARMRPEFEFQPSPVGQDEARQPVHSTLPHIRSARTGDHEDIRETRIDLRAARCRTSGVRAQGITRIFGNRAWNLRATRCRTSGVRASGEHNVFRACTGEHNDYSGTRAPGIRTTFRDTRTGNTTLSGTRAPENTATTETRAAETCNFDSTNDPHTRTTEGTAETYNRIPTTLAIIHRYHASHRARKFRHLMEQIQPNSVPG